MIDVTVVILVLRSFYRDNGKEVYLRAVEKLENARNNGISDLPVNVRKIETIATAFNIDEAAFNLICSEVFRLHKLNCIKA